MKGLNGSFLLLKSNVCAVVVRADDCCFCTGAAGLTTLFGFAAGCTGGSSFFLHPAYTGIAIIRSSAVMRSLFPFLFILYLFLVNETEGCGKTIDFQSRPAVNILYIGKTDIADIHDTGKVRNSGKKIGYVVKSA